MFIDLYSDAGGVNRSCNIPEALIGLFKEYVIISRMSLWHAYPNCENDKEKLYHPQNIYVYLSKPVWQISTDKVRLIFFLITFFQFSN